MPISTKTDRSEVKAALRRLGATQLDIATAIEVSEAAISLWFKGQVTSPKLDASIPAYVAGLEKRKCVAA